MTTLLPSQLNVGRKAKKFEPVTTIDPAYPTSELKRAICERIKNGTLKHTKIFHIGENSSSGSDSSIEIPMLLELCFKSPKINFKLNAKLKEIFENFKKGVLHFTGPAGIGKTTLLKTIAKNIYNDEYESFRDVKIVVYVRCGDLNTMKRTTQSKLLMSYLEPELDENEISAFESIFNKDPRSVLFILDGLDTFPHYFYDREIRKGNHSDERERVYNIIVDLLNKASSKGYRVITSARDLNLGHLNVPLDHDVILLGLSDDSVFKIALQHLGSSSASTFMKHLEGHSNLRELCRTPIFLISSLLRQKKEENISSNDSIADNLLHLLNMFLGSEHHSGWMITLKNLKCLAFDLLKGIEITFSKKKFEKYKLRPEDLPMLVFHSPDGQNRAVFFVHQFIHDLLAALHLVGLKPVTFENETKDCLKKPWFSFSFRLMCSVLCNKSTFELAKKFCLVSVDEDLQVKQNILMKILSQKLSDTKGKPGDTLTTYLAIHECGEVAHDIIRNHVHCIQINYGPNDMMWIKPDHIQALGSMASKSNNLDVLSITCAPLYDQHLAHLESAITKRIKTRRLDISGNNLSAKGMRHVGCLTKFFDSEELDVSCSGGFFSSHPHVLLLNLKLALQNTKVKVLNLSYSAKVLGENDMTEATKAKKKDLMYELKDPQSCPPDAPMQIIHGILTPGDWTEADYDFCLAVRNLLPNVTDEILLYGWKFPEHCLDLLKKYLHQAESKILRIVLSKECILEHPSFFQDQSSINLEFSKSILTSDHQKSILHESIAVDNASEHLMKKYKDQAALFNPDTKKAISGCKDLKKTQPVLETSQTEKRNVSLEVSQRAIAKDDITELYSKAEENGGFLKEFTLRDCNLDEKFLSDLLCESDRHTIQIEKFGVTATDGINKFLPSICKLMAKWQTKHLSLEESEGDKNTSLLLYENLKRYDVQLETLDMSNNPWIDLNKFENLLTENLRGLKLVGCDLKSGDFEDLNDEDSKVESIDLSLNLDLDDEAIEMLPGMLCKNKPLSITLQGCELTKDDMDGFDSFSPDHVIHHLDLSHNATLESDGVEKVGEIVKKHRTVQVSLSSCGIKKEGLTRFSESVGNHKLRCLDLSRNCEIGSCLDKVVELLTDSKDVDLSDCKFTSGQIKELATSLKEKNAKIEKLILSDSGRRRLDEDYMNAICNFSKESCRSIELVLPHVDEQSKEKLRLKVNELKGTQVCIK